MKNLIFWCFAMSLSMLLAENYPNKIYWKTANKTGYFTDSVNWEGGVVPSGGQTAAIDSNGSDRGDFVIKFPSGTTTVNSLLYFTHEKRDSSITIDTTEGALYHVPTTVPADWQGFGFLIYDTHHYFNFENTANGDPTCWFGGGKIKAWTDDTNIQHVDIESGNLNWHNPNGATTTSHLILSRPAVITAKDGSSLNAGVLGVRNGTFSIEGGNHTLHANVFVGDSIDNTEPIFKQTGGIVNHTGGYMYLGNRNTTTGRLVMAGSAVFTQTADRYTLMGEKPGSRGVIHMSDNAQVTFGYLKMNGNVSEDGLEPTSEITVSGNSILTTLSEAIVGVKTINEVPEVTVNGDATLNSRGVFRLGYPNQGKGAVNITENATFLAQNELYVYDGSSLTANSEGTLRTDGNALTVKAGGIATFSDDSKFEAMNGVSVDGGFLKFEDQASFLMNTNVGHQCYVRVRNGGTVEFNGGDSVFSCIWVDGTNTEGLNAVYVKGGNHLSIKDSASGGFVPLEIGATGGHNLFEMSGGTFTVPRMVLLGNDTTGDGSAIFRLTGGEFEIDTTSYESVFNVADSTASKGRVELLGGTLRCQYIRGWNGSPAYNSSATGWAALYADGGTLKPNKLTQNAFLTTFDEAILGAKGLIVDTEDFNISISQAFEDEENKAGLFTKAGEGKLTVSTASEHSNTLVNDGELYFNVSKFGKNVTVQNSASISTVGSPTSIEVESLTLGTTTSVGYIKIDSGDTITITGGSAGLNVQNGVIICDGMENLGEYQIFNITGEVDTEELAEELSKIKYSNSNKDYSFTFTPVATDGGYTVKLVVEIRTSTDATWLGTSGDWATPANWSGSAVPGANTVATFSGTAANKTVSIASEAQAFEANVTGGDYTFEGEGELTLDKIAVSAGSLNVNVAQKPNMGMEVDVSQGASVTFSKAVSSVSGLDKIVKSGVGPLTLGVAPNWYGSWAFNAGKTVVAAPTSLGSHADIEGTVSIGAAKLMFDVETSQTEITVDKKLEINSGNTQPGVIDAETSVKFTKGMDAVSGGLFKMGTKDVTVKFPQGTSAISASSLGSGTDIANNPIEFDSVTEVPTGVSGSDVKAPIGGLTVAEGVLRLQGEGKDKTVVNQRHSMLVGGGGALKAPAVLEVSGMTMNQGDSGIHCFIGGIINEGSAATNSVLRVIDGAYFNADTINLAIKTHSGSSDPARHVVAVTNATVISSWVLNVGVYGNENLTAGLEIGENGLVNVNGTYVDIRGKINGTIADGGTLRVVGTANNTEAQRGLYMNDGAFGGLNFVDGGTLDAKAVSASRSNPLAYPVTMTFDGGIFKVRGTDAVSMCNHAELRTFNAGAKGMYVDVEAAESRHTIAMSINGEGGIIKTGAGELFIAKTIQARSEVTVPEGVLTANCAGQSIVKGGALTIEAGAAREDLKVAVEAGAELRVSGSQTLGAVSGGGTITTGGLTSVPSAFGTDGFVVENESPANATLVSSIARNPSEVLTVEQVPHFENITLSNIVVDYATNTEEEFVLENTKIPVARIGDGVTATPATWRSVNRPALINITHTVENGVVYANLAREGFILFLK